MVAYPKTLGKSIYPKKQLGQHFLTDPHYCRRVVQHAQIEPGDTVVEIGPGTGQLTELLQEKANRVVGIEFDPTMIDHLKSRFAVGELGSTSPLQIIQADILQVDWQQLMEIVLPEAFDILTPEPWFLLPAKIVGNLPYYISTRILTRMTETNLRFQSYVFMTQREVASRITASAGSKDFGYFSLLMQFHFTFSRGFDVPPGAFRPKPEVVSHVTRFIARNPELESAQYSRFVKIIQTAFQQRRKTLWNNLKSLVDDEGYLRRCMETAGLAHNVRPEEVSLEQYLCMTRMLSLPHE
jgi:16S rRNA (adenine1518-N6/adenine1519-N6)-dimethyltransferase